MKIAITGASGTGKSTLAKKLAEKFDIPLLNENFVVVMNSFHYLKEEKSGKAAKSYLEECINWITNRYQENLTNNNLISDRIGFDVFSRLILSDLIISNKNIELINTIKDLCIKEANNYDLIAVTSITLPWTLNKGFNEDGLARETSYSKKIKSQCMILGLLYQFTQCKIIQLSDESMTDDSAYEELLEAINEKNI